MAAKKAEEAAAKLLADEATKEKPLHGLLGTADPESGPIPSYPGRNLDPRGAASMVTQRIVGRYKQL